jgi:hypothetical protein
VTDEHAPPWWAWERGGTFTGAGKPIERTVRSEADAIARHRRLHVKQIASIVNR